MDRESLRPVAIAVICLLALVVAASTLTSTTQPETGGGFPGPTDQQGIGEDNTDGIDLGSDEPDGEFGFSSGAPLASQKICVPWLTSPEAITLGIAGVVVLWWLLKRRYDAFTASGAATAIALPVGLVWVFLTGCGSGPVDQSSGPISLFPGNGSTGGGTSPGFGGFQGSVEPIDVPVILYVVVGVVVLGVIAMVFSDREALSGALDPILTRADDGGSESEDEPVFESKQAYALGKAAGRAADRIESDADVENQVFQAWADMTHYLDVPRPESSTPAEFASAAVEAGMDREDVDELTRLFEAVRYGGEAPTEDREQRAIAALRRIESTYADE